MENLILELKRKAKGDLVTERDAYEELVDQFVSDKVDSGEISAEEDVESLKDELLQRWPEVEEYVRGSETEKP
jgi:hypothetical protein